MNNPTTPQRRVRPLFAIVTLLILVYCVLNKGIYYQVAAGIAFCLALGLYLTALRSKKS